LYFGREVAGFVSYPGEYGIGLMEINIGLFT
jgi:hypothetical protein